VTSLFRRLIGDRFEALPIQLRTVHGGAALRTYSGRCRVERGAGFLSRIFSAIASLPPAADSVPIRVSIESHARGETWNRDFDGKTMRSSLSERGGLLEERLGPTVFHFALDAAGGAIDWRLVGVRSLGIPLPLAWFDKVSARESVEGDRYRFDVRAEMPVVGLLVRYAGTLDVEG
jgi:Domain of unknown function (DUF4166)